jgi:2,4-dienoyl-CoA reductase-like NADH-dependent reductase (Old Yellow Enzyme family)
MANYYRQRASAGLIITEGVPISPMAVGGPRLAGIWNQDQIAGWRSVTNAVHEKGGRIFAQLWHVGRVSHPEFIEGRLPVGASAIAAAGDVRHIAPPTPWPVPRALDVEEIPALIKEFGRAAENAAAAGFDGVELHGANGYILDAFLCDSTNQRTDEYGGLLENRGKVMLGAVDEVIKVFGGDRVGIQLSPRPTPGWHGDSDPIVTFGYILKALSRRDLAFVLTREGPSHAPYIGKELRPLFNGAYIANECFTPETANEILDRGEADAVAFGKLFLANPDLPARIARQAPLNVPDAATFYSDGSKGYDDYPALAA